MADLTYCEEIMKRARMMVLPSDLADALKYFKEKTGKDATRVEVCPKIIPVLQDIMPEGVELLPHNGVLTFEIWMTAVPKPFSKEVMEKPAPQTPIEPPDTPPSQEIPVAKVPLMEMDTPVLHKSPVKIVKIKKPVRHGIMGRPPKVGPVNRVTEWRRRKKLEKMGERLL